MTVTMTRMILGAGLTVAAAFGEPRTLVGDINFPFRLGPTSFSSGHYEVKAIDHGGGSVIQVIDRKTKKSAMALPLYRSSAQRDSKPAHLVFQCSPGGECYLSDIYAAEAGRWVMPAQKLSPAEKERTTALVVPLRLATGD